MEHTLRGRGRDSRTYVILIIEKYTNNLSGTDGFRFRYPDEAGTWRQRTEDTIIAFPQCLKEHLRNRELMAPTLREQPRADAEPFAVLYVIVEDEEAQMP